MHAALHASPTPQPATSATGPTIHALTAARHFLARGSPWNMPSSGLTSVRTCRVTRVGGWVVAGGTRAQRVARWLSFPASCTANPQWQNRTQPPTPASQHSTPIRPGRTLGDLKPSSSTRQCPIMLSAHAA